MSENETSQEKTEEPTPRRKEKAREEGQVVRSRELTTSILLVSGTLGLILFGKLLAKNLKKIMQEAFELQFIDVFDHTKMFNLLFELIRSSFLASLPLLILLTVVSLIGPLALGGWSISTKSFLFKWNRLNPINGFKRMFSAQSFLELIKSIIKVVLIGFVAGFLVLYFQHDFKLISMQSKEVAILQSILLVVWISFGIALSTIIIALIDIPFQINQHLKKMKMTHQQVKDELKDVEGKPEVKSRIRQLQRELATSRMMANVPEADVIITNPEHFSVALKYNPKDMDTPILVAKGVDLIAFTIRSIGKKNKVEIVESAKLARAIYYTTELNQAIPSKLYLAVAKVLAYVFQLNAFRNGKSEKPQFPRDIPIPPEMKF